MIDTLRRHLPLAGLERIRDRVPVDDERVRGADAAPAVERRSTATTFASILAGGAAGRGAHAGRVSRAPADAEPAAGVRSRVGRCDGVILTEPLGYIDFLEPDVARPADPHRLGRPAGGVDRARHPVPDAAREHRAAGDRHRRHQPRRRHANRRHRQRRRTGAGRPARRTTNPRTVGRSRGRPHRRRVCADFSQRERRRATGASGHGAATPLIVAASSRVRCVAAEGAVPRLSMVTRFRPLALGERTAPHVACVFVARNRQTGGTPKTIPERPRRSSLGWYVERPKTIPRIPLTPALQKRADAYPTEPWSRVLRVEPGLPARAGLPAGARCRDGQPAGLLLLRKPRRLPLSDLSPPAAHQPAELVRDQFLRLARTRRQR